MPETEESSQAPGAAAPAAPGSAPRPGLRGLGWLVGGLGFLLVLLMPASTRGLVVAETAPACERCGSDPLQRYYDEKGVAPPGGQLLVALLSLAGMGLGQALLRWSGAPSPPLRPALAAGLGLLWLGLAVGLAARAPLAGHRAAPGSCPCFLMGVVGGPIRT